MALNLMTREQMDSDQSATSQLEEGRTHNLHRIDESEPLFVRRHKARIAQEICDSLRPDTVTPAGQSDKPLPVIKAKTDAEPTDDYRAYREFFDVRN